MNNEKGGNKMDVNKEDLNIVNAFDLGNIDENTVSIASLSGVKKVAVLLMALGPDIASNLIKKLPEKQVHRIGVEITNLQSISSKERKMILEEFVNLYKKEDYLLEGGPDYTRKLFLDAFGNQKGDKLLEEVKYDTYNKVFSTARNSSALQILECIKDENPQTIAIILSHIQMDKAGQILSQLPKELQAEVAIRIGTISNISPAIIKSIDMALERKLNSMSKADLHSNSGLENLIAILSNLDRATEKSILEFIENNNALLSEQIKANMFVFEDIVRLDGMAIQKILKEVNVKEIAMALKGAPEEISEVIFGNQSPRARESLKEEIEMLANVKRSKIEDAQQKVVAIIRRLEQEGAIEISKGTDEA